MFSIFRILVNALINLGFTHSYVSLLFNSGLDIWAKILDSETTIINPLRHSMVVNGVYIDYPLVIHGYKFLRDLIELFFWKFDAILGMD